MHERVYVGNMKRRIGETWQRKIESHRPKSSRRNSNGTPVVVTSCDYKSCFLLVRRLLKLVRSHLCLGSVGMNPMPEGFSEASKSSKQVELAVHETLLFQVKNQMLNIARVR